MTGRLNNMSANFLDQAFWWGKAQREEVANRQQDEEFHRFSRDSEHFAKGPVRRVCPYGLGAGRLAPRWPPAADSCFWKSPWRGMNVEEKEGHEPLSSRL